MKNAWLHALLMLMLIPGVVAVDFTEDFEDDTAGSDPTATFYTYTEPSDVGYVDDATLVITGTNSMKFEATGSGSNRGDFELAGPTRLTNITFTMQGVTEDTDGVGSRQVIKIQSSSPVRTMVEFHVYCAGVTDPTGCEFRVKWENVDSNGQILVNSTVGDDSFIVNVRPDWVNGEFDLSVDGVDDGTFPFLESPVDVGRIRVEQASTSYSLNMAFDDWTIQGATTAVAVEGSDVANGLKNFADDINFSTTNSLFLLGFVVFTIILAAVIVPLVILSKDNSVVPAVSFIAVLVALFMVRLEWWQDWIGIAAIILASALVALIIRRLLMGIRDASTNAGIVAGSLGYFIIATSLLGFSGYASDTVQVPTSSLQTAEDVEAETNTSTPTQSFTGAVVECVITGGAFTFGLTGDCSQDTTSETWATITDVASTIFNFARSSFTFLFQLLTFSLPIPAIFNAMIVLPPAAALATVGFSFITRSGS